MGRRFDEQRGFSQAAGFDGGGHAGAGAAVDDDIVGVVGGAGVSGLDAAGAQNRGDNNDDGGDSGADHVRERGDDRLRASELAAMPRPPMTKRQGNQML